MAAVMTGENPLDSLDAAAPKKGRLRGYFQDSRNLRSSILVVIPLFVIYQVGILATGGVRNGVDFMTDLLLHVIFRGSVLYYVIFNLAVLAGLVAAVAYLRKRREFNPKTFLFIIIEGTVYGLLLGFLIGSMLSKVGLSHVLQAVAGAAAACPMEFGVFDNFVLSIGAGLYEELVFRLILLGGSVLLLTRAFKVKELPAVIGAVIVTSLVFSAIHYVGGMADPFTLYSFAFRFLAGVVFAVIYYGRGFAVAVYTHAIYDIIVLVF